MLWYIPILNMELLPGVAPIHRYYDKMSYCKNVQGDIFTIPHILVIQTPLQIVKHNEA